MSQCAIISFVLIASATEAVKRCQLSSALFYIGGQFHRADRGSIPRLELREVMVASCCGGGGAYLRIGEAA